MLADTILSEVCHIVDVAALDGVVPAGAFSAIQNAANALQNEGVAAEALRATEDLSVALLRLEWGLRRRDTDAVERAREVLRGIRATLASAIVETCSPPLHC